MQAATTYSSTWRSVVVIQSIESLSQKLAFRMTERYEGLDIEWSIVEAQLVEWWYLSQHDKNLRVEIAYC